MNIFNEGSATEKQEWAKPEVQVLSAKTGTLGPGTSGDDGFDGGIS